MKKFVLLFVFIVSTILLFSVHNLTINGVTEATASLGDELEIYFEYETIGNSATLSIMLDVPLIDLSQYDFLQGELVDGGSLDTTPIDGIFQGSITAFWQPPAGIPLIITVVDEDVSEEVNVEFIELNSTFSISGSIKQESDYGFDLPVYPALANVFYDTELADLGELDFSGDISQLLSFFEDRYLISEITSFLGNYTVTIPDEIADVSCIVLPLSLLDIEGSHTTPLPYFGQINGAVNDIDFLYTLPDGIFTATVINEDGESVANAIVELYCEETEQNALGYTDESGNCSLPLNNGTFSLMVMALGYEPYANQVVMNDQDISLNISLSAVANENQDVEFVNTLAISTYPNPFTSAVNIEVKSSLKQAISIKVYNLKGQLVNTITEANISSQNYIWNGKDSNKKSVANGIYYLRVKQGTQVLNKKILMIK